MYYCIINLIPYCLSASSIEVVCSQMVEEEIGVHRESHRPLASKLANLLTLGYAYIGDQRRCVPLQTLETFIVHRKISHLQFLMQYVILSLWMYNVGIFIIDTTQIKCFSLKVFCLKFLIILSCDTYTKRTQGMSCIAILLGNGLEN